MKQTTLYTSQSKDPSKKQTTRFKVSPSKKGRRETTSQKHQTTKVHDLFKQGRDSESTTTTVGDLLRDSPQFNADSCARGGGLNGGRSGVRDTDTFHYKDNTPMQQHQTVGEERVASSRQRAESSDVPVATSVGC